MTNAKRSLAIASVIAALGAGSLGIGTVLAAQHGTIRQYGMPDLVNALAQKFNLAPNDVQSVIDQQRKLMTDQQKKRSEERITTTLAQAVKDGKLTQAQADLIIAKHAEMKKLAESLQEKNSTDRRITMKAEIDSLKKWVVDNKIPEQFIIFGRGSMMKRGHGGFGMHASFQKNK